LFLNDHTRINVLGIFMLNPKKKQHIIKKFKTHEGDTGSPQVQIAILTEEIKELTGHLKTHKKDFSSRRGLFRKVNQRRKLLKFLEKNDFTAYEKLIAELKLKKRTKSLELETENNKQKTNTQLKQNKPNGLNSDNK